MKEALPEAASGKPIEIWFEDEARIGQSMRQSFGRLVLNLIAGDPIKPGRIELLASCGVERFYADENGWTPMHADGVSDAAFWRFAENLCQLRMLSW